ncbi:MAG: hypothetical protein ACO3SE_09385 [Sedimenticolaceae bacterium]
MGRKRLIPMSAEALEREMKRLNERHLVLETEDDEALLQAELEVALHKNDNIEAEDWLDSEYHRIFVAYTYADVTSMIN